MLFEFKTMSSVFISINSHDIQKIKNILLFDLYYYRLQTLLRTVDRSRRSSFLLCEFLTLLNVKAERQSDSFSSCLHNV